MKKKLYIFLSILLLIIIYFVFYNPKYVPEQRIENISSELSSKLTYQRYCLDNPENEFNIKSERISVKIPITHSGLRIIDIKNASSDKFNAIIVILDGVNGIETPLKPAKYLIVSEFNITKIKGLKKDRMKNDNALIVKVFHDDDFKKVDLNTFKDWVNKLSKYPPKTECLLYSFAPKEEGGGVLGGGGGI